MFNTLWNSIQRNGLVWEWLLDGNALDTSWNWNNWTATNVTYIKTSKGYQSQTGGFNGSNSSVNLWTNKFPSLVNNCTLSAWVRSNSISIPQSIFSNWDTLSWWNMWWCFWIKLDWANNTYTFRKLWIINENTWITPSVWKDDFICLTITSNVWRLYINSVLVWTWADSNAILNNTQKTKVWCHTSNWSNTQFYNWNIQWVRLYNRVLSQDEIQLLYIEWLRKLWPTNIAKYPSLLSGLVGYWDFRGTAHNIVDWVLATTSWATLTTDRFWNSNSAYSFTTTNNIQQADSNSLTPTSISICAWIKTTNTATSRICRKQNTTPTDIWYDFIINSVWWAWTIQMNIYDTVDRYSRSTATNVNDWNWHFVVASCNNANNIKLYLDWVETSYSVSHTTWFSVTNTTWPLYIWNDAALTNPIWTMDSMFIVNRALSADEVKLLHNLTSQDYIYPAPSYDLESLRDWLVLDLNEQWQDLSWNGNNGFLVNLSPLNQLRQWRAKGLSYPNNAYIWSINSSLSVWNIFSVNFWVYIPSPWTFERCMTKWSWWNNDTWRWWYTQIDNIWRLQIVINSTWNWLIQQTSSSNLIQYWKWNMCTFVYNSTAWTKFYIDWKLQTTTTLNWGLQSVWTNANNILVNRLYINGLYYYWSNWVKYLQERIRNRALLDNEIQALYYSQKWNFIY